MADSYDDGTFTTAAQHGDVRIEYPFFEYGDTTGIVIHREMIVERSSYTPTARGTALAGFTGSRLTKETNFVDYRADLMLFKQIYATVPGTFDRYDGITVNLPKAFDDGTNDVLFEGGTTEMPVRYAYEFSTNIASLTRFPKFQVLNSSGYEVNFVRDGIGATSPTRTQFYSSTERVAEPTKIMRYMGDIFMAITPYITPEDAF